MKLLLFIIDPQDAEGLIQKKAYKVLSIILQVYLLLLQTFFDVELEPSDEENKHKEPNPENSIYLING